jgi:hypothetical protein
VATFARELRRLSLRHPWMAGAQYPTARPSFGSSLLRLLEHYLAALDGIGLDIDAMFGTWMTVSAFVNGYVSAELAEAEASRRSNLTQEQWRGRIAPYVRRVMESGRYPMLTRLILEAEDFPDPDVVFERRLGYVLDGLPANKA